MKGDARVAQCGGEASGQVDLKREQATVGLLQENVSHTLVLHTMHGVDDQHAEHRCGGRHQMREARFIASREKIASIYTLIFLIRRRAAPNS